MHKELSFNNDAKKRLLAGVETLAKAVKSTLGPKGRTVMIETEGAPKITKDGVTVAKSISLKDKFENMGVSVLKNVAQQSLSAAGDGTTTATILAEAIISNGVKAIESGSAGPKIKDGIDKAKNAVVEYLQNKAKPIDCSEEIFNCATVSANGDTQIGKLIAEAMEKVGKDGTITVDSSKSTTTSLNVVEGVEFDNGYLSPYFCKEGSADVHLENPLILLYDKKIANIKEIMPLLQSISSAGKPLLIIAEDVEGEVLPTLVFNNLRGTLTVCAVKCPAYGALRKAQMEDIAVLTGGKVISEDVGLKLEDCTIEDLGSARRVQITKNKTTIIEGKGDKDSIQLRGDSIRAQIESTEAKWEKKQLQDRLAKLVGGVAVISVGATSEIELNEKKDRIDDALCATKCAVQGGILPGGGISLLHAQKEVFTEDFMKSFTDSDELLGANILKSVLDVPFKTLCDNANLTPEIIIEKLNKTSGIPYGTDVFNWGYNFATSKCEDMLAQGTIDPFKVIAVALDAAASVAGLVLSTNCIITTVEDEPQHCNCQNQDMPGF